jgi:hypothetical protein
MEWLKTILEAIKLPVKIFVVIAVFSLLMLLLPADISDKLSLSTLTLQYRHVFAMTFIFSSVFVLVSFGFIVLKQLKTILVRCGKTRRQRKAIKRQHNAIDCYLRNGLNDDEKAVLREFIFQQNKAVKLPTEWPVVDNLVKNHILEIGMFSSS